MESSEYWHMELQLRRVGRDKTVSLEANQHTTYSPQTTHTCTMHMCIGTLTVCAAGIPQRNGVLCYTAKYACHLCNYLPPQWQDEVWCSGRGIQWLRQECWWCSRWYSHMHRVLPSTVLLLYWGVCGSGFQSV